MKRRRLLAGCSTVLVGMLAGCGGDGGSGEDGETPAATDTPDAMGTDTPEPTATPTEVETDTPAESGTPTAATQSGTTHEIGETFSVGDGNNEYQYRFIDLFRSDRIGSSTNYTTADGTFLIVVVELTNPGNSESPFPRDEVRIQSVDGSVWRRFAQEGTEKIAADERINVNPIGNATLSAGETRTGAVAYDVDPETEYRLWIRPAGDAQTPEHFVPLGKPADAEELQGSLTG